MGSSDRVRGGEARGALFAAEGTECAEKMRLLNATYDWRGKLEALESAARSRKKKERDLPLEFKPTFMSRQKGNLASLRRDLVDQKSTMKEIRKILVPLKYDHKDKQSYGEKKMKKCSLLSVVANERDLFRTRFGNTTRRDEIEKLKRAATHKAHEVDLAEKQTSKKFREFEQFIQKQSETAAEARRTADKWTRKISLLTGPLQKLMISVTEVRAENTKIEMQLEAAAEIKKFVLLLSHNFIEAYTRPITMTEFLNPPSHMSKRDLLDPLDVAFEFEELEERNLRMIENQVGTELEESLEDWKRQTLRAVATIKQLKYQHIVMECSLARLEERISDLKFYVDMFSAGNDSKTGFCDDEEALLTYKFKIKKVYGSICDGSDIEFHVDELVMLTSIETRFEDLLDTEEQLSPERVRDAQREIERKRRLDAKERKLNLQAQLQKERNARALERSNQSQQKRGRKLMKRSIPPDAKRINPMDLITDDVPDLTHDIFFV